MFNHDLVKDRRKRLAISLEGLARQIHLETDGQTNIKAWSITRMEKGQRSRIQPWELAHILKILQLDPREVFTGGNYE